MCSIVKVKWYTAFLSLVRYSNKTRLASVMAKVLFSMYLTSMENAVILFCQTGLKR